MFSGFSIFGTNSGQLEPIKNQTNLKAQIHLVQLKYKELLELDTKYLALPVGVATFFWAVGQMNTLSLAISYGCIAGYSYFYLSRQQHVDSLHRELTKLLDLYRERVQKDAAIEEETLHLMQDTLSRFIGGQESHPSYLKKEGWDRLKSAIKTELNLFIYGSKTASMPVPSL